MPAADPISTGQSAGYKAKSSSVARGGQDSGYPHGHWGNLNDEQSEALAQFKLLLEKKGSFKPGAHHSHDDPTLLRFLRARRWVIKDAFKQFKVTEEWRANNEIDVLYDTIELEAYEESRKLYPQWTGRRDRRGIPVYLYELRHLVSKTISSYDNSTETNFSKAKTDGKTPANLIRLFALYENLTRFVQPLCTELTDRDYAQTPITLSNNIVDVSGVSLHQFWNLKAHMQAASQLASAHCPETLDSIFIVGAPVFFSTVWGWVKRWFDPITVSKIFILSPHDVKSTLESFIDRRSIPKQYGGELDFAWGQMPDIDPKIRDVATWENGYTEFPKPPLYWRPTANGKRLECIAVGCVNQVQRMERVCTIPKTFKQDTFEKTNGQAAEESQAQLTVTTGLEPATVPSEPAITADGIDVENINGAVQGDLKRFSQKNEQHAEVMANVEFKKAVA